MALMIPAVACFAVATPALGATQQGASENWAGYVVTSNDGSGFSAASGQWKVRHVACTANSEPTYSAYWVGLGGRLATTAARFTDTESREWVAGFPAATHSRQ